MGAEASPGVTGAKAHPAESRHGEAEASSGGGAEASCNPVIKKVLEGVQARPKPRGDNCGEPELDHGPEEDMQI